MQEVLALHCVHLYFFLLTFVALRMGDFLDLAAQLSPWWQTSQLP